MNLRSWSAVGVASLVTLLGGCGGGSGGGSGGGGGGGGLQGNTLRVFVTDAPFPFDYVESATVVIEEIRVHEVESDSWTTVFSGSESIDLVPLAGGVEQLLVEADIEPGTYDQVRLIVEAGEVVLSEDAVVQDDHVFNTEDGDLFFPSGAQTGIKVHVDNDIVVTTQLSGDLVLDFDLSKNFKFNGPVTHNPGVKRVIFTPSVRATNASVAGSLTLRALSDQLTPGDPSDDLPLAGATVEVFDETADPSVDEPIATASTGEDGVATVSVPPGTYQVVVSAASHEPATTGGIVVTLANLTDVGDVVLEATGEITGVVMSNAGTADDTSDDVVVANAQVDVHLAGDAAVLTTVSTDASGAFQVTGLAAGSYDLFVTADGFQQGSLLGVAATVGGTGHTILLTPLTAEVSGTVVDADAAPVPGVEVTIVNGDGVVVFNTTTGDDGAWATTLPTGEYEITYDDGTPETDPLVIVGEDPATPVVVPPHVVD